MAQALQERSYNLQDLGARVDVAERVLAERVAQLADKTQKRALAGECGRDCRVRNAVAHQRKEEVAGGTARVASNIGDVSKGANATGTASSQVLASAHSLSRESDHLKDELEKFLRKVRAA